MAFPSKGSRRIVLSGVEYRWYVRHRPSYGQGIAKSDLSFAVAHAEAAGTMLMVKMPYAHPSNWLVERFSVVLPSDVARSIEAALVQGWQPTQSGKPFCMSAPETQNKSEAVTSSA